MGRLARSAGWRSRVPAGAERRWQEHDHERHDRAGPAARGAGELPGRGPRRRPDACDRRARPRPRARAPATLPDVDGASESAARRPQPDGTGAARGVARLGGEPLPAARRAEGSARGHDVGRPAADGGDRTRADGAAAAADDRRAVPRARPQGRGRDPRHRRAHQPGGRRGAVHRAERAARAGGVGPRLSPRKRRIVLEGSGREMLEHETVRRVYLGL